MFFGSFYFRSRHFASRFFGAARDAFVRAREILRARRRVFVRAAAFPQTEDAATAAEISAMPRETGIADAVAAQSAAKVPAITAEKKE